MITSDIVGKWIIHYYVWSTKEKNLDDGAEFKLEIRKGQINNISGDSIWYYDNGNKQGNFHNCLVDNWFKLFDTKEEVDEFYKEFIGDMRLFPYEGDYMKNFDGYFRNWIRNRKLYRLLDLQIP